MIVVITNDMKRSAVEIAQVYKFRWQIELLFAGSAAPEAALLPRNQSKRCQLQIYAAMIAYILLRLAAKAAKTKFNILRFTELVGDFLSTVAGSSPSTRRRPPTPAKNATAPPTNWPSVMRKFSPDSRAALGAGWVLAFGPVGVAARRRAFSAPFRLSARQGGARALAPRAPSEAVHAPLVGVPDTRIDRVRQDDRHDLVGVSADHPERSDRGVQIVPPLLLQFAVRVKRLRVRINISRRPRKVALYNVDCRNAMMTRLQCKSCTRPKAKGRYRRRLSCV